MQARELLPGTQFIYRNQVVEIVCILDESKAVVNDLVTKEDMEAQIGELKPIDRSGSSRRDPRSYSETEWESAKHRCVVLSRYIGHDRLSSTQAEEAAFLLGCSTRQVRRYFRKFVKNPSISGQVRERRGPKPGSFNLSPSQEHAIEEILTEYYDVKEPETMSKMMLYLKERCEEFGCPVPAQSTVYTRVKRRETFETYKKRNGRQAALEKFEPRGKKIKTSHALEYVQIDHTKVDVIVVSNDRFRRPLGRPWLSVAIDVHTRCVLGIYLSLDAPSAISVGSVIAHSVLPKTTWLKSRGFKGDEWPMYGRMDAASTDNGKDLRSDSVARGCNENGIVLYHRPVGRPHWGGHIERFFRTLMLQTHSLPGTTFSKAVTRKSLHYKSEDRSLLTMDELQDWLIHAIIGYHANVHRGLGKTPYEAWVEARTVGENYVPPALVEDPQEFLMAFLPSCIRRVNNYGINLFGLTYWNDGLAPYIPNNDRKPIYFDPRDISRVWIRDPEGKWIVLHPRVEMDSISLYEYQVLQKRLREEYRNGYYSDLRLESARAQDAIVKKSKSATRKAHKAAVRESKRLQQSESALPREIGETDLNCEPVASEVYDFQDSLEILPVENWGTGRIITEEGGNV